MASSKYLSKSWLDLQFTPICVTAFVGSIKDLDVFIIHLLTLLFLLSVTCAKICVNASVMLADGAGDASLNAGLVRCWFWVFGFQIDFGRSVHWWCWSVVLVVLLLLLLSVVGVLL